MRYTRVAGIAILSIFALAARGEAQTHRFYIGGSVMADKDSTGSAISPATLPTWSIVAGFDASRHIGIRGVFEAPHKAVTVTEGTFKRPTSALPVHEQLTYTRRTMTYGVLGVLHGKPTPVMRVAGTIGFMTVTHDSLHVVVSQQVRPDGTRVSMADSRLEGDHDWPGLSLGVEAAWLVAQRLEIAPEFRMILFGPYEQNPYIFRSGVGLRWRF